jgi:peptide/nickel transport system substrate-binding protein
VEFDDASRPVPGIARWQQLSPMRYRFELGDDGRTFSDGSRLSAVDVAATYGSIIASDSASPHRALLSVIEAIEVLDPDRLEFLLRTPDPQFPAYLGIGILPARLIASGHAFQRDPVGSGPFRLVQWPGPGRLVLERRRDGQRIAFVTVKDPNVRVMKLLRGEVQMLQNDLPPELIDFLRRRDGIRVQTAPGINFSYLGFNLDDPATGDWRVRRAIAHAVDRDAIVRHLFQGGGRLAEALLPPEHWAGAPGLRPPGHDPARARALLAAAGYGPGRPLRLYLKTSSDPFRLRLATVLQAQLRDAGIDVRVQSYDWGTFFGDIKAGRFQLYGLTWVGIRTPDIFRYAFHSDALPPDGANRGRYRSAVADRLIDTARAEPSEQARADLYRALQTVLHHDLPYVPLWYEDQVFAARAGVIDYRLAADGNYDGLRQVVRRSVPLAAR